MKFGRGDSIPIGKARRGSYSLDGKTPSREKEAALKFRSSDTHQMSWKSLMVTCGVPRSTFYYQTTKLGLSPLQILKGYNYLGQGDKHLGWSALGKITGLNRRTVYSRRHKGWNPRQCLGLDPPPAFHMIANAHYWKNFKSFWRRQTRGLLRSELKQLRKEVGHLKHDPLDSIEELRQLKAKKFIAWSPAPRMRTPSGKPLPREDQARYRSPSHAL